MQMKIVLRVFLMLAMASIISASQAQEVAIPDPGLNAAIRAALGKPAGPLTQQDLLSLTVLNAHDRNIYSLEGLEAARNLNTLLLYSNHLTNFFLPTLTNLVSLTLSGNALTNVTLPRGLKTLFSLLIADNPLPQLALPDDLSSLEELVLDDNRLSSFDLPPNLTGLGVLDLSFNALTNFTLPSGLTNLDLLRMSGNSLSNFTLPSGLTRLSQLYLDQNQLTSFALPAGLTNLHILDLFFNQLNSLGLPSDQQNLISLDIDNNRLTNLELPMNMIGLSFLHAGVNQLTNFSLPADAKALRYLDLADNQLASVHLPMGLGQLTNLRISGNTNLTTLTLPAGMTNLAGIFFRYNGLTNLTLPADLMQLNSLDILGNKLITLNLPAGLTNLAGLFLAGNQLTNLTLRPDMLRLNSLVLDGNPLTQLVLSELEATNLAATVAALENDGIPVAKYPQDLKMTKLLLSDGAFRFGILGPPGFYQVLISTNLADWSPLDVLDLPLGSKFFLDTTTALSPQRFYRVRSMPDLPANLVFIPANTFRMGSPTNEVGRQVDEGPQTIVRLSHGFWIGKYEVTQAEYLAVTGENPSGFPGDLSRPVESVSFFAASNYCVLRTQQELAAGRIPPGSHYRLPTEAEWECAARAGSSTRFYYGDDLSLTNLSNYAWFGAHDGITTHPVGMKLPNAWGLYDMAGNVWEWCQDWYGNYPGGAVTDPQGPASNAIGWKVVRGGAWEGSEFDCRSARRWFDGASPFISDFIIGFRVVLVP